MKIAIVGLLHHPIAEPFAGGMESHTWWLAKKLMQKGHEVTLFASGDSDPEIGLSPCIDRSLNINPAAREPLARQTCNMNAYADVIKQVCNGGFDIVHNNALHPLLLLSAVDMPVPMLMVLHTPVYDELAAAVQYADARNGAGNLGFVAVSNSLAEEWCPITTADVVYNGIDIDGWPYSPTAVPECALWYGRIVPEKAPHLAIQAALLAGYSINIAGPIGNPAYFEEKVLPLVDNGRVFYLGHLDRGGIQRALSQASVFVNTPMWEEPYGIVYAEALASGTPVAAFDRGAASEIITPRCGTVVAPQTVEALAEGIAIAAQKSRGDCRKRAETFCHINSMIAGYERLYLKLIAKRKRLERARQKEASVVAKAANASLMNAKAAASAMTQESATQKAVSPLRMAS